jgi:hypothetical protein
MSECKFCDGSGYYDTPDDVCTYCRPSLLELPLVWKARAEEAEAKLERVMGITMGDIEHCWECTGTIPNLNIEQVEIINRWNRETADKIYSLITERMEGTK